MKEYALNKEIQLETGNIRRRATKVEERRQVEIEESLEVLSRWLDDLIRIPVIGWRVGLDAIIGLVPGLGDTATALASFYILASGVRYGVPKVTLLRMALNIAIDYLVGAIPFAGDAFDLVWKANKKNLDLIKQRATVSPEEKRQGKLTDWLFVLFIILGLVGILIGSIIVSILIWSFVFEFFYKQF